MSRDHAARRGLPTPGVAMPADRRFHRADGSAGRRRRYGRLTTRLVRWGVVTLVAAGICAWLGTLVLHSELLRIRRLVVRGNAHLSTGDIESILDGIHRENLLQADLPAYRQRLLDSPWVADVRLSRVLPATLDITVVERVPMAVARQGDRLFLVDDSGVIIDDYGPEYAQFDLPVVDGLLVASKAGTPAVPTDRARLADDLLTSLGARPDLRKRVSQIDVSNARDAVVLFDDDPAWLHLGDARFVERLQNYIDLRPRLIERFRDIDYVDLRFDERVYLRGPAKTVVARH
jgi:cell division protein FtsQ